MSVVYNTTIRLKRGEAATWASLNPVLDPGEPGFEKDTYKLKIGDGVTAWNSLAYFAGGGGSFTVDGDSIVFDNDELALKGFAAATAGYTPYKKSDGELGWSVQYKIVQGYLYEGHFYEDSQHTTALADSANSIYIDIPTATGYFYMGSGYAKIIAAASNSASGLVKLYATTGQNTDGAVDQKTFSDLYSQLYAVDPATQAPVGDINTLPF